MNKTLELVFETEQGKTARFTVDNPKENLTEVEIQNAMEQLLASNAFISNSGTIVAVKEARIVEKTVTEFGFAE